MNKWTYSIHQFRWSKHENAFFAIAGKLWPNEHTHIPFPNGKREFFIENEETGGFRRFRFDSGTLVEGVEEWEFRSEDGIRCVILADETVSINETDHRD